MIEIFGQRITYDLEFILVEVDAQDWKGMQDQIYAQICGLA